MAARLRKKKYPPNPRKFELAAMQGKGTEYEPLGLQNQPGITTLNLGSDANTGKQFKFVDVPSFEEKLEDNKLSLDGASFLFHHVVKKLLKQERILQFSGDTGGAPYVLPMTDKEVENHLGYKMLTTGQLSKVQTKGSSSANLTSVFFGQFSHLWLAEFGMMEIRASREASDSSGNSAFLQDQTWFLAKMAVDTNLDQDAAFIVQKDATTV
jgi:HK97 family phage major capsid protein